jgi:glyoxylase-like metal-dependent hydrolase (beta-lactamase superfamily II)
MKQLPMPAPLPESIPIPTADPPAEMDLVAVPTGVNHRTAAYAYAGGSVFDRRDFYIGAALIKHPQGDLLVDSGFGRDIATQLATMPRLFRMMTRYDVWKPAADQLQAARYDFDRLSGILLTHAHWDHMSGIPDFPGLPVLISPRDRAAFYRNDMFGNFRGSFREFPFNWRDLSFESGPYLGFPRHHDLYRDGSIVCVPAPGHTPGSVIVFVTLPNRVRYALVGDLVWQREGLTRRVERPLPIRLLGDFDAEGNRQNIQRMVSIMRRIPDLIVVPSHDQHAFAEMGRLRNVTTKGLILSA